MQIDQNEEQAPAPAEPPPPTWPGDLTTREEQVARMIALGHGRAAIARALDISEKTVDTHRARAMAKTGTGNAVILARFAIRAGLVPVDQSADATGPAGEG